MLEEAKWAVSPLIYNREDFFEKEETLRMQERIKAMLNYRLLPFLTISIPDDAEKDGLRVFIEKCNINCDVEPLWYAIKNYQLVTSEDLKSEFWEICPDIDSIPKILNIINVKFEEVKYEYVIDDIHPIEEGYDGLVKLVEKGTISKDEFDKILMNIYFIKDRYNFIIYCLSHIYQNFRTMADSINEPCSIPPNQPKSFQDYLIHPDKKILIGELSKILCGKKGKIIACVILALRHLELIAFTDGEKKSLYDSMRVVFGNIGSNTGINDYLNCSEKGNNLTNLLKYSDIEPYINQLKTFTVV